MTRIHSINKVHLRKNIRFEEVCDNTKNSTHFHSNNSLIFNTQFHSAYGSKMPGRYFSSGTGYRYGFNGKENDNDVSGIGNKVDFEARVYDSRLGRFLSIAPLAKDFTEESNYIYACNNPIYFIDKEGENKYTFIKVIDEKTGNVTIELKTSRELTRKRIMVADKFGHGYHYEYEWYDIVEFKTITKHKNGKTSISTTTNETARYRTTTNFDYGQTVVNAKLDLLDGKNQVKTEETYFKFGYNVYSSEVVNSRLFAEIKGKAIEVENLDISGMVIPGLPNRGIGESLETLEEVSKDIKQVADIYSKSFEAIEKIVSTVEAAKKVFGNKKQTQEDTLVCPAGCKIPITQKPESYHAGEAEGYDTIKANPN